MAMSEQALTERDLDVLRALDEHERSGLGAARPLDIGGSSGSHHSATLAKLVERGLVERSRRNLTDTSRPAYRYVLTDWGRSRVKK